MIHLSSKEKTHLGNNYRAPAVCLSLSKFWMERWCYRKDGASPNNHTHYSERKARTPPQSSLLSFRKWRRQEVARKPRLRTITMVTPGGGSKFPAANPYLMSRWGLSIILTGCFKKRAGHNDTTTAQEEESWLVFQAHSWTSTQGSSGKGVSFPVLKLQPFWPNSFKSHAVDFYGTS